MNGLFMSRRNLTDMEIAGFFLSIVSPLASTIGIPIPRIREALRKLVNEDRIWNAVQVGIENVGNIGDQIVQESDRREAVKEFQEKPQ
jgi:hypothetical protein